MRNLEIKSISSLLATALFYVFGGFDMALQAMIVMVVIDYITGVAKGYVKNNLNSEIGFKGIIKKISMFAAVAVAVVADRAAGDTRIN